MRQYVSHAWPAILLAVLGVVVILIQTRYGPGASGDSSSYLMGAQNMMAGHGFYRFSGGYELKPITGFPPGFSALLAMIGFLIHDLYDASRILNAALMGVNLILAAWLIHRYTGSWLAGALGQALILSSSTQVNLYAWVMSEPLYISTSLAFFVCLTLYLEGRSPLVLTLGGAAAAAGILTRYAGLSMVAAGGLAVLVLGGTQLWKRIRDVALFGAVSLVPFVLWTQRNAALAGTRVDRQVAYHAIDPDLVRLFMADISSWFVPHAVPLPTVVRAMLAIVVAAGILGLFVGIGARRWVAWRKEGRYLEITRSGRAGSLPWTLILYLGAYAAVLAANSLLLDASTTATAPARYLAPAYVAAVVLMVCAAYDLLATTGWRRIVAAAVGIYLVILLGYNVGDASRLVSDPLPHLGYTARRVTWAPTVSAIDDYEVRGPVVSNNPEMIYILTGKPAYVRPISYDQYQEQPREDYQQQLEFTKTVLEEGSVFVVFDKPEADDTHLIEFAGLDQIKRTPNARFYAVPGKPSLPLGVIGVGQLQEGRSWQTRVL